MCTVIGDVIPVPKSFRLNQTHGDFTEKGERRKMSEDSREGGRAFRATNHELHQSSLPWFDFAILISRTVVKSCKQKLHLAQGIPFEYPCLFSKQGYMDLYASVMGIEMPGLIPFAIYKNREGKYKTLTYKRITN